MNKKLLLLFVFLIAATGINAQQKKADKATEAFRYEIECAGIGTDGTYLIKVWSYSKNAKFAVTQAKKNAVHGIIFKGFSGGAQGCVSQKPLASSPNIEDEKADFFKSFFADGGDYMKYVSESSDGNIDAADRVKVGKEYKIGVIVSVSKDALRRYLEESGVVRGLSSGF
ncbi:hypothetical protein FNO01nite_03440 [Flavobacterium noncentrifugens]|uniref:Uncharacterized protein n=1 Tax=Flavobacterium noncentrifugens TaxID=1128970 RepID=A0A1G8S2G3_9FLAO|nr:hypothetical protein [Flavobacterium noncentrifugens]GEP49672.1 hypothetical protein FNO01nite_03440 [Flavobacterium noncentrifugens]SDJ23464.1 hypothetical protein SAMN04487935_0380 [Flavobacterium noncentrifugens]